MEFTLFLIHKHDQWLSVKYTERNKCINYFKCLFLIFKVLCNTLWYITNQYSTINEASVRKKTVLPIPKIFSDYERYNEVKRQLSYSTLYSFLMKPGLSLCRRYFSCPWT